MKTQNSNEPDIGSRAPLAVASPDAEAKKAVRALQQRQRREGKKVAKREKTLAARKAEGHELPDHIKLDPLGNPEATYETCFDLLEMNAEVWGMAYDILGERHVFRGLVPWEAHYGRELCPAVVALVRNEFIARYGVTYNHSDIEYALESLCRAAPVNPVVEYLDRCVPNWDGVKRVATWLRDYLGADDDEYHSAIGCNWLMAAVARARELGTKFDNALIFEGKGGAGKSTAIELLASEEFFSDAPLGKFSDRDAAIGLQGVWLYEMGELNDVKRGDMDETKQFLSIRIDRYRDFNGPRRHPHPRLTIFCGSTNDDTCMTASGGSGPAEHRAK